MGYTGGMADVYAYPDYVALLAAVRADPGSDLPRLVLADRLDDWGEADRAELIRLQCVMATDEAGGFRHISTRLRRREWELLGEPRGLKMHPRPAMDIESESASPACRFTRGFVESVTCPAAAWVAHGDALLAREPVRTVTLTSWPHDLHLDWNSHERFARYEVGVLYGRPRRLVRILSADLWSQQREPVTAAQILTATWPGVEFVLPSHAYLAVTWGNSITVTAEDVRRVGEELVAGR